MVVSLVLARGAYRYDFKCRVHQLALISLSLFGNDHGELLVRLLAVLTTQDLGVGCLPPPRRSMVKTCLWGRC